MPSASFQPILDAAFADYVAQIGIDLTKHPITDQLRTCHSPDDVLKLLEDKANEFKDYREGSRKLIDCLKPVVDVVHAFSGVLGGAVSSIPFQPAGAIFAGVDILLAAASGVSSSYDALIDLFECIGNFLKRLRIYTDLPLTPSMTDIIVKIMVEILSVLALATKQTNQGRFKKFAKKLLGESEIEAVLQRLDRLTQEEGRMTMTQTLEVVHGLMNTMKVVMDDGKASMDGIWRALDAMHQMANEINKIRRDQLQKESRSWLSPPDPSPNYNIACEIHQDGTATWFFQGSVFTEWNVKGSLLWIHGKPGSGKSILMSSIIREIDRMCKAGLASMAYFYFDFRDTQKQHRRGLLSSLVSQLSAESDPCYRILSRLYSAHAGGTRQPSDDALLQCLIEMLEVRGQPATYIIIDAIDECPNISGMPTAREKVLECLEELIELRLQNVHICLSSRPEVDIRTSLEPLAPFRVSLDDETGQKDDISGYIESVVHSDRRMRKWSAADKQLVISRLSDKADGMFRWVYCQLENLRRCFPSSIRGTLDSLPKTLDATYEHTLLGIDEEKWQFAHRLFQCLAVSVGPLRVEELAEILAVRFEGGALPQFNTGWQLGNAEEAVLSACSSLVTVTNVNGSRIVQFAHFSVKEFLTSGRLATASENLSRYHISPHLAHTTLAQASLGVLLQLDGRVDKESIRNFPLADYASRHWLDHCHSGDVSPTIQDATKCLFDREKPHFSAWVWIYDIDDPWRGSMPTEHPEQPGATPLYYAILCSFLWLIEHLIVTYPGDVDAMGGYYETPLLAAVRKEDVKVTSSPPQQGAGPLHRASPSERADIVRLLLEHNADVNLPNEAGETPLNWASRSGKLEISRLLVQGGADVRARDNNDWTPLHVASRYERLDVLRFLIDNGADVNTHDNEGLTPLHSASHEGHINIVKYLIQHGADVNYPNEAGETPLDWASWSGRLEISQLLVQQGADVRARDKNDWTPLHTASYHGRLDVVQFLIDSGADVESHDNEGSTPLHSASQAGHINTIEFLIQHGANVNTPNQAGETPLDWASGSGKLETSRLLVQHGADVQARDKNDWTLLQTASYHGHLDVIRFLIDSGADVNSHGNEGSTSLHSASQEGHINIVEFLIQHGADVDLPNEAGETPLDWASGSGKLETSRLLVQHGADVQSRDKNGWSPLQTASYHGRLDVVRFLIDNGADVNSHDNEGSTPLHSASREGHLNIVEFLIQHDADVQAGDNDDWIPLQTASYHGRLDVVRFLIDRGADVDFQDNVGRTSLQSASQEGHIDVVNLLILHGADVNLPNGEGETPLDFASKGGKLEISQLLVQQGADVQARDKSDWIPLQTASHYGHLDVVRFLIDSGADVNSRGSEGLTPLHSASQGGHIDIVEFFVQHDADVQARDNDGWTPLQTASQYGHLEVVRFVIDNGADVKSRDNEGLTPLHSAASNGHLDVVKLLLERGADPSIHDESDRTPLDLAVDNGEPEVAEFLSEHMAGPMSLVGGAVNATPSTISPQNRPPNVAHPPGSREEEDATSSDSDDEQPGEDATSSSDDEQPSLYTASENGQLEIVRSLLDRGFDVNERYSLRVTALDAASMGGHLEVAKLLIERGADVDPRDRHGMTPLITASDYGHVEVARLLLNHGADVDAQMRDHDTALHLASFYANFEMIQLLLECGANVNIRGAGGQTARQVAQQLGHHRVAELLSGTAKSP